MEYPCKVGRQALKNYRNPMGSEGTVCGTRSDTLGTILFPKTKNPHNRLIMRVFNKRYTGIMQFLGGLDGTRTRDLRRDRAAF